MNEVALILLTFILLMLGVVLLLTGLRGRRVDDHPWCAACRFDLYGRWPEVNACPECGAALKGSDAVRHGRRVRRARPIIVAAVLLGFVLMTAPLQGVWFLQSGDLHSAKPSWLLVFEARIGGSSAEAQIRELTQRLVNGDLSEFQAKLLIQPLLDRQGDADWKWDPSMGEFLAAAFAAGLLTDAQRSRYFEQMAVVTARFRTDFVHESEFPYALAIAGRGGNSWGLAMRLEEIRVDDDVIHKEKVGYYATGSLGLGSVDRPAMMMTTAPIAEAMSKLPTGTHEAVFVMRYWVIPSGTTLDQSQHSWAVEYPVTLTVHPVGTPLMKPIQNPALAGAVREALGIKEVSVHSANNYSVQFMVNVSRPPVPLAFDVFLRDGDQEYAAGKLAIDSHNQLIHGFMVEELRDLQGSSVDVILRPSERAATWLIEARTMWGSEIVFEDVPVVHR